ncbi:hypothetical protein BDF19DRAFT_433329 [Syncephalis fuscata]|nr:hypothetical protein BDF19DRAFT_433329 [Syncephalis fuscata]
MQTRSQRLRLPETQPTTPQPNVPEESNMPEAQANEQTNDSNNIEEAAETSNVAIQQPTRDTASLTTMIPRNVRKRPRNSNNSNEHTFTDIQQNGESSTQAGMDSLSNNLLTASSSSNSNNISTVTTNTTTSTTTDTSTTNIASIASNTDTIATFSPLTSDLQFIDLTNLDDVEDPVQGGNQQSPVVIPSDDEENDNTVETTRRLHPPLHRRRRRTNYNSIYAQEDEWDDTEWEEAEWAGDIYDNMSGMQQDVDAVNLLLDVQRRARLESRRSERQDMMPWTPATFPQLPRLFASPTRRTRQQNIGVQEHTFLGGVTRSLFPDEEIWRIHPWRALMEPITLHGSQLPLGGVGSNQHAAESDVIPERNITPLPSARAGYSRNILPEDEENEQQPPMESVAIDADSKEKGKQPVSTQEEEAEEGRTASIELSAQVEVEADIIESDYICARCNGGLAIYAPDTENIEKIGSTVIYANKCGHVFCGDCLKPLRSRKKCPVCNAPANSRSFRRLYLA